MGNSSRPDGYLEDYEVGRTYQLGEAVLEEADIVEFARQYDPQPFHADPVAAKHTEFGGLIASGYQVMAVAMRLLVEGYLSERASIVSPGIDEVRWHLPVRPGDRLRGRVTVTDVRPSTSKPDRGTLRDFVELHNQHGELVMSFRSISIFRRRPADQAGPNGNE